MASSMRYTPMICPTQPARPRGVRACTALTLALLASGGVAEVAAQGLSPFAIGTGAPPVPGYVAPVAQTMAPEYVDDTRGLFMPAHAQLRQKTATELAAWAEPAAGAVAPVMNREAMLNRLATGYEDTSAAMARIAATPSPFDTAAGAGMQGQQLAQAFPAPPGASGFGGFPQPRRPQPQNLYEMPSLATGGQPMVQQPMAAAPQQLNSPALGVGMPQAPLPMGREIAVGSAMDSQVLDLQNGIVRIREERITVRRALQRMLDQVGGAGWTTVWDLDEVNAALPEMEISLYAEEPFIQVLNALLARLQSRSGQPLRVIKYDQTQRLVITDRATASQGGGVVDPATAGQLAVTDTVLKESRVSLHYDEIPLVDALENMVNQAGKGQWRLRMYAGTDQVLKPAHIEEPFGVAVERILKIFNLRYEIFPGGKLIVVTAGDTFGFRRVN